MHIAASVNLGSFGTFAALCMNGRSGMLAVRGGTSELTLCGHCRLLQVG